MKESVLKGAAYGLLAWSIYGIVELALNCVLPLVFASGNELLGWQWPVIGLLLGGYALGGLLFGSLGGALLAWTGWGKFGEGHRIMAVLTLVVAFVANLVPAWPLARSEQIALTAAFILGAAFVAALASTSWRDRTAFLANSWAVSLLLLGSPWASRDVLHGSSAGLKAGASLLLLFAIIILAALLRRLRPRRIATIGRQAATVVTVQAVLGMLILVSGKTATVQANQTGASAAPGKPRSGSPNVVLITMDTVRADHLSVYGYERDTTPHLREFASRATVYRRAIAAADYTLPSHASIFTGLYPGWHGAYVAPPEYPLGRPLPSRVITLAEILRSHGYRTAALMANHAYLDPMMGLSKGFDTYDLRTPVQVFGRDRPAYLREGLRSALRLVIRAGRFENYALRAGDILRHTFTVLDARRTGQPFFLFLNFMDAHSPYTPAPPFDTLFPGGDPRFGPSDYRKAWLAVNGGRRHLDAAERRHLVSQYDGAIAYIDFEIGNLLTRLRESGLYENTLIVITSDHGEAFGEHDLVEHALGYVDQDQVRVPLLIKYPAQNEGHESDALASGVDLMPTVMDVAGYAPPSGVQGNTLRLPRSPDSNVVYSEARTIPSRHEINPRFRGIRRTIFSGSLKLIAWTEGPSELYDLAADPDEEHNLYRAEDPRGKALEDQLAAWTSKIPKSIEPPRKLDKSSVERLKSLGYAQ